MTGRGFACDEARGLLDERLDRPLLPGEDAALDTHLAACSSCRAAAADMGRIHSLLGGSGAPVPPTDFADRVIASLDRGPGAGGPRGGSRDPVRPRRERLLLGALAVLGTATVAALAVAVFPVDAAAATVGEFVPGISAPVLAEIPPQAADLLGGLAGMLPPWAAAAGGAAAVLAAAAQAFSVRRSPAR